MTENIQGEGEGENPWRNVAQRIEWVEEEMDKRSRLLDLIDVIIESDLT